MSMENMWNDTDRGTLKYPEKTPFLLPLWRQKIPQVLIWDRTGTSRPTSVMALPAAKSCLARSLWVRRSDVIGDILTFCFCSVFCVAENAGRVIRDKITGGDQTNSRHVNVNFRPSLLNKCLSTDGLAYCIVKPTIQRHFVFCISFCGYLTTLNLVVRIISYHHGRCIAKEDWFIVWQLMTLDRLQWFLYSEKKRVSVFVNGE